MPDPVTGFPNAVSVLVWLATTFVGAVLGSLFGGYFGKRGEIRAVHGDLDKVIAQSEATTKATESIKEQLTNQSWTLQRQWEMKRDAVMAVVVALGRARDGLMYLAGSVETTREGLTYEWQRHPKLLELSLELLRRLEEFDEKRLVAAFVCSDELSSAMTEAGKVMRSALSTVQKDDKFSMSVLFPPVRETVSTALLVARKEIGIQEI
jgi:hypothetical protein